ncbi:unnamed protein product [Darwinula stevensoni]|uniref:C3H1-type domain-containing protein n=1 Tax=Darwinula stevensoni TaxID=69355 RepID=A0A7R9FPK1_9CRUS|nr:unnamed protein product [Darwinula stevensoni]CAG0897699.1 unnamed protein product [Darwinula stevensoni]
MKYLRVVSLPDGLQKWLAAELESRGIDAVVYAHYVLSLLAQDSLDPSDLDQDLPPDYLDAASTPLPGKKLNKKSAKKMRKEDGARRSWDCEDLKRHAAVECLLSASDETCGIEKLVDELCAKLKEFQECESLGSRNSLQVGHCDREPLQGSSNPVSPEERAKQYFAAFPALSDEEDQPVVRENEESVWNGKANLEMKHEEKQWEHGSQKESMAHRRKVLGPLNQVFIVPHLNEKSSKKFLVPSWIAHLSEGAVSGKKIDQSLKWDAENSCPETLKEHIQKTSSEGIDRKGSWNGLKAWDGEELPPPVKFRCQKAENPDQKQGGSHDSSMEKFMSKFDERLESLWSNPSNVPPPGFSHIQHSLAAFPATSSPLLPEAHGSVGSKEDATAFKDGVFFGNVDHDIHPPDVNSSDSLKSIWSSQTDTNYIWSSHLSSPLQGDTLQSWFSKRGEMKPEVVNMIGGNTEHCLFDRDFPRVEGFGKVLPSNDKGFLYHKGESCFEEVNNKWQMADLREDLSTVLTKFAQSECADISKEPGRSEENLLTSPKTHFKPIKQESLDVSQSSDRYEDGATFTISSEDEDEKPQFVQEENGYYLTIRGGKCSSRNSPEKFMIFHPTASRPEKPDPDMTLDWQFIEKDATVSLHDGRISRDASAGFCPKFKLRSSALEKKCQTDQMLDPKEGIESGARNASHGPQHPLSTYSDEWIFKQTQSVNRHLLAPRHLPEEIPLPDLGYQKWSRAEGEPNDGDSHEPEDSSDVPVEFLEGALYDSMFCFDLEQLKAQVSGPIPNFPKQKRGIMYSDELEAAWRENDLKLHRTKRLRSKLVMQRPCSFFLEGTCRRADCRFSHDLASIPCRFWEKGACFKGYLCPFLHATQDADATPLPETLKSVRLQQGFELRSEADFPTLAHPPAPSPEKARDPCQSDLCKSEDP